MLDLSKLERKRPCSRWNWHLDQFRGPSVSKGVIVPILPATRVVCEGLGMGDYSNHTEIRLTEVHANVERLLDVAVTLG